MKIQLIAIGNELLNGKTQDKNAIWLARECFKRHIQLQKIHVVADDQESFQKSLALALSESDVVITTGGLGPTPDDLTKDMLSNYFQLRKIHNPEVEKVVLEHFVRGQKDYDYKKYSYHICPLEFKVFKNPTGYAPGLGYITPEGKVICATPGVPNEYQSMMLESVFDFILENSKTDKTLGKNIVIKTWKLPEADIFGKLCPSLWKELENIGSVSSLPHMVGVDIGVYIEGESPIDLDTKEQAVMELINCSPINDYIWQVGQLTLPEYINNLAKEKGLTFAFAESATGGLCTNRISDVAGASSVLEGGIVCYSKEVKVDILGVNLETLNHFSVYSDETALEMANGVKEKLCSDIGVAITGVAGPGDDGPAKEGQVSIAVSTHNGQYVKTFYFKGDRKGLKFRFSQMALFLLLEEGIKRL